jgi:hypothetical protein
MSSEDEVNAARLADVIPPSSEVKSLFADQFEWITWLLEFARTRQDLHFIIRLHPRMFPNKRESVLSPVVAQIMKLIEERPSNTSLNLPTDNVSMYDIMQIVDVLLNFRSSAGAELAAFGIPVVAPANSEFFTYPAELNLVGTTPGDYAAKIDTALASGWSIEQSRRAFRWYAFLFSRVAVDFSESVRARPIAIRPKKPGFRLWVWRRMVWVVLQYGPLVRERIALRNRRIAPSSRDIFYDVLDQERGSLAESTLWTPIVSSPAAETALLHDYFRHLIATEWGGIIDPQSLAGRVRAYLGSTP